MEKLFVSATLIALLSFVGCGTNHAPPAEVDAGVARQSLERALGAWQKKAEPRSLMEDATAPLHVADEDWTMGYQLQSFELAAGEPQTISKACVRFEVKLDLTSPQGAKSQKKVQYNVTTSPAVSVVRVDAEA